MNEEQQNNRKTQKNRVSIILIITIVVFTVLVTLSQIMHLFFGVSFREEFPFVAIYSGIALWASLSFIGKSSVDDAHPIKYTFKEHPRFGFTSYKYTQYFSKNGLLIFKTIRAISYVLIGFTFPISLLCTIL